MGDLSNSIVLTLLGIGIGFLSNFLIARYKARYELKGAIANTKANFYIDLWKLCEQNIESKEEREAKYKSLNSWYTEGGGLLLSFGATDRFIGALKLLQKSKDLTLDEINLLKQHLTWIRTEMKFEVGTYSRKEAKTKLPHSK
jgi:uncharacterized membrane protein YgaE (UPF0421/DUF939 family)